MGKTTTIDSFFKKKRIEDCNSNPSQPATSSENKDKEERQAKIPRVDKEGHDIPTIERDPGLRRQIWDYPIEQRDAIRRAYLRAGPFQPILHEYPLSDNKNHARRFQPSWFNKFPTWLEYSPIKDAAFCLHCFVFSGGPGDRSGKNAFAEKGFRNWKKVNDGKNCAFLTHVGSSISSPNNICVKSCETLMNQSHHIENVLHKQSSQSITNNRLRLKTSIDAIKWLTFQGCALRGNDESSDSQNRGNFIELIKFIASYDQTVANVVLDNAPGNAQYVSPRIQKEILHILARKIRDQICKEIGDTKYCILVDEAQDESGKEQMAVVLRFVDTKGNIKERFFNLVHVTNTTACNLKNEIKSVLSQYNLSLHKIRGQGYDGASNMRGEWKGLQALILNECPFAYYVHCLAHRLQLALVGAAREINPIYQFFSKLNYIINVASSSPKRKDQLRDAFTSNVIYGIANNELETGSGLNQVRMLQRAGDTRWGSHFSSIESLLKMFDATYTVLDKATKEGNCSQRGEANAALDAMMCFEFILILHMMRNIMGITNDLCQALQRKSQDILNSISLVSTTKALLEQMRKTRWNDLITEVITFCEKHDITVPELNSQYTSRGGRRRQCNNLSVEEYYRINVFYVTIDTQWQEINHRFSDNMMDLLTLSSSLDPSNNFKKLNVDQICELAYKFYPGDFNEQERIHLKIQAHHYEADVPHNLEFKSLSTVSDLCLKLVETRKALIYPLINRLIRLILTLPVSTATTERSFSAMNIVKNRLRNKMDDEFLADCLLIYIERNIAEKIDTDSIIDEFYDMKERRVRLR